MNIKKNEPLPVKVQADGSLLILPAHRRIKIVGEEVSGRLHQDPVFLFRCLVGSYIAGYTAIAYPRPPGSPPPSARPSVTSVR